jgi:very-short-patch-repair endonuclease
VGVEGRFNRTQAKTSVARKLRGTATEAERKLWRALRNGQTGVNFRRQHPVGPYVLDFYAPSLKLSIEVDGGHHAIAPYETRDTKRTAFLRERGISELRFWNNEGLSNIDGVVAVIVHKVDGSTPTPALPLSGGGSQASHGPC